jgi:hypothetical protein
MPPLAGQQQLQLFQGKHLDSWNADLSRVHLIRLNGASLSRSIHLLIFSTD